MPEEAKPRAHWLRSFMQRASEQRHLLSVRDGVVAALPLVLVGSFFLLIAQPPVPAWERAIAHSPWQARLLIPLRATTGLISIYVAFSVGASLARRYDLDSLAGGLLPAAAFLASIRPVVAQLEPGAAPAAALPMTWLGPGGLFVAIILGLLSVEVMRFLARRNWTFQLPEGVPPAVARSFASLLPAAVVLTGCWLLFHVAGLDPFDLMQRLVARPLALASNSLPAVVVIVMLDSVLWLFGIHALAVMAALQPVWLQLITENMQAATLGHALPNIGAREFYIWFVWLGGSGASLCLPFMFWRARSAALRSVARLGLLPGICNINEPIIFGTPIVMNPTLAVPFIGGPAIAAALAWVAFRFNWIVRPHVIVPWTLPAPLGAYLTTGGDLRAVLLMAANLALITLFYWPFVRAYDRRLAQKEVEAGA
jgi:PTS system cellobiose-specific IIC component